MEIDRSALKRAAETAAETYDDAAVVATEIGNRVLDRFGLIRLQPRVVLDVGCGTGRTTEGLLRRYRGARVVGVDLAVRPLLKSRRRGTWRRRIRSVCADAEALPFGDGCCDLLFSNMMLYWCLDPGKALAEFHRVLRPGGLLMFATLGPDTLRELREAWSKADPVSHTLDFSDMHDLGDHLIRGGWAEPVMDMEMLTVTFSRPGDLFRDLRRSGEINARQDRRRGLTGRRRFEAMLTHYRNQADRDGRYPATWEVVYGHAWRPTGPATSRGPGEGSETRVAVEALRSTLPGRRN